MGYEFVSPKYNTDSLVKYKPGYSHVKLFEVDTISMDETGEFILIPKICESNYVEANLKYRKIGGNYVEFGGTIRDFVIKVIPSINNATELLGLYKFIAEAEKQISATISADDKQFIPPPPLPANAPDTIILFWNRSIPGASFTILDPKARIKSAKLCWSPKLKDVNGLNYTFTATAIMDNAWFDNEQTVKVYSIQVTNSVNSISILNPNNYLSFSQSFYNSKLHNYRNGNRSNSNI